MEQNAIIKKFMQNSITSLKKDTNINLFSQSYNLKCTQHIPIIKSDITTHYPVSNKITIKKLPNSSKQIYKNKDKDKDNDNNKDIANTINDAIDIDDIDQLLDQPLLTPLTNSNQIVKCIDIDWSICANCIKYFLIMNAVEFVNIINHLAAPLVINNYQNFICSYLIRTNRATIYYVKPPLIELWGNTEITKSKSKKTHIRNKSSKLTNVQINYSLLK